MRFVLVAAGKDLRRRLTDPAALVIWIGIPLLLSGLMYLVAGGGDVTPRAKVLVVDQDDSFLSRLLAGSGGGSVSDFVEIETVPLDEGERRIDAGDATALLVLPEGFQQALLEDTPAEIVLVTNPAQRILPGIVEEALEILVDAVFYGQRLFGPTIRRMTSGTPDGGTPSNAEVAAISVEIAEQIRRVEPVLIPPALSLEVATENPQAGPGLNFGQLFLPGMLFMSFLFIAQGMSVDIWEEKTRGTLRRVLATPQSASRVLAGKLAAGVGIVGAVAAFALLAAVFLFDMVWTRVPLAWLWCAFAGGVLLALLTLLQTVAGSERGAHLLSSIVIFPLMMIGGSFFPFETMPDWMATAGRWTPNGLAVVRLKELLYGDPSAMPFLIATLGMGAPALAAFLLAGRRLRGSFAVT